MLIPTTPQRQSPVQPLQLSQQPSPVHTPKQQSPVQTPKQPSSVEATQQPLQVLTPQQPSPIHVLTPQQPSAATPARRRLSVGSPQLASILLPIGHSVPHSLFRSLPDSQPEVLGLLKQIAEQQKQSTEYHKLTLERLDALITVLSSPAEPSNPAPAMPTLPTQPFQPPVPPAQPFSLPVPPAQPLQQPAQPFSPPANQLDDKDLVIFNLRSKSSWAKNFAVRLVRFYFTPQELEGRNVRGVGNKLPLDMNKILKVKEIVFKFFPSAGSEQEILWRDCHKAIDTYSRNRKTMDVPRSS